MPALMLAQLMLVSKPRLLFLKMSGIRQKNARKIDSRGRRVNRSLCNP